MARRPMARPVSPPVIALRREGSLPPHTTVWDGSSSLGCAPDVEGSVALAFNPAAESRVSLPSAGYTSDRLTSFYQQSKPLICEFDEESLGM